MNPRSFGPFLILLLSAISATAQIVNPTIKKQPVQKTIAEPILRNIQITLNTPFFIREEKFWVNESRSGQLLTDACAANDNRWKWVKTDNPDGTVTIGSQLDNTKKIVYRDNQIMFQGERRGQRGYFVEVPAAPGSSATGNRYISKFYMRKVSGNQYWLTASDRRDSNLVYIIPVADIPFNTIAFDFNTLNGWNLAEGPAASHAFAGQPSGVSFIPFYDSPVIPAMPLGGDYWKDLEITYFSKDTKTRSKYINTARPGDNRFARPDETKTGALTSLPFYNCGEKISFRIGGTEDAANIKLEVLQKAEAAGAGTIAFSDGPYRIVPGANATGHNNDITRVVTLDVTAQKYSVCRIRIIDNSTTGHIAVDNISLNANGAAGSEPRPADPAPPAPNKPIWGAVDMHTHPMSYIGMGGKLMHGQPDGDPHTALGNCNCTHGGWGLDNTCGNYVRAVVVNMTDKLYEHRFERSFPAVPHPDHPHDGYPAFKHWPTHSSVLHQQMWFDWMKRAKDGGMKVIVALTVNSELLGRAVDGNAPFDDKTTADRQIDQLIAFVRRHNDFMDTVTTSARLRRVVNEGKMGVIIGMEVDNIGNFYRNVTVTKEQIRAEITRLKNKGVRYMFPIHVTDNKFGGAAAYEEMFNYATKFVSGQPITGTVPPHLYPPVLPGRLQEVESNPDRRVVFRYTSGKIGERMGLRTLIEIIEAGGLPPVDPITIAAKPVMDPIIAGLRMKPDYQILKRYYFDAYPEAVAYDGIKLSGSTAGGHRNVHGLTAEGEFAVEEMMRQGMIIDMDHASEKSVSGIMRLAMINDYPVNSGHNGLRAANSNENSRTAGQIDTMRRVGGMMGVGWGENTANGFYINLKGVYNALGNKNIALGSDINGFVATPSKPTASSQFINYTNRSQPDFIQKYTMPGSRSWDFNTDGVAHYGLVPDFFQGMKKAGAEPNVLNAFFLGAEYFAQMWEKCERRASAVRR